MTNRALEPLGLRARQYAVLQIASARKGSSSGRSESISAWIRVPSCPWWTTLSGRHWWCGPVTPPTAGPARHRNDRRQEHSQRRRAEGRLAQAELMSDLTADEAGLLRELVSRVRLVAPAASNS